MGKKINQLLVATDAEATNPTKLIALADPVTGEAKQITMVQARLSIGLQRVKYVATGAEGVTITHSDLTDKNILFIVRESGILFPVDSSPDSLEFSFDGVDVTLGLATGPGERILIFYVYA